MAEQQTPQVSIGRNAAIMSVATIVSRITGFVRTWAMAFAMGNTLLSSAYSVANNLPNLLYEMVMGGILVTAFLPVYMQVKKEKNQQAADTYASSLFTLTLIVLGIASVLSAIFASQLIWTQNFLENNPNSPTSELATYFFRFFAIQIVLYGCGSVISGILNASRDYLWPAVAPIFNNLVTIITMFGYVPLSKVNPQFALAWLGVGTSLGVLAMLLVQLPALKKNNINLRLRLDLKDPALKDTLKLGLPAVIIMLMSSISVSVQNASALKVIETGPSIIAYSRLWYTLPYSFLAVPITTTMFTELADMYSEHNISGFTQGVSMGLRQLLFTMVPFALYLIVFSYPLTTLFHVGAFDKDAIYQVGNYIKWLAPALPFYAMMMYLNKVYSAHHSLIRFAIIDFVASLVLISSCIILTVGIGDWDGFGIKGTALARILYTTTNVALSLIVLRFLVGRLGITAVVKTGLKALLFGVLGAASGWGVLYLLEHTAGPLSGSVGQAFLYIICGGLVALFVTYGLATALKVPEAKFIGTILNKVGRKLGVVKAK